MSDEEVCTSPKISLAPFSSEVLGFSAAGLVVSVFGRGGEYDVCGAGLAGALAGAADDPIEPIWSRGAYFCITFSL
jgi:hypothetical protein